MSDIFVTYLGISLSVGVLSLALMLLSPLVERRYAAKWRLWIWVVLAVRLMIPVTGSLPERKASLEPVRPQQSEFVAAPAVPEARQPAGIVITIPQQITEPIVTKHNFQTSANVSDVSILDVAVGIWLGGAALFLAVHILSYSVYKRRLIRSGIDITDGKSAEVFDVLRGELEIRTQIRLIRSNLATSPMMIGFFKPTLVLPSMEFDAEQLGFIIKHELVHFKHRDVWLKLLMMFANSVHWFNPIIWLMRRQASVDMEFSCDEGVMRGENMSAKKAYSEALFATMCSAAGVHTALSTQFNGGKKVMKKRFKNILSKINKKNGAIMLVAVAVLAAVVGALVICTSEDDSVVDETAALELRQTLSEAVGGEKIYAFEAADFDGDGDIEAFGAVGESYFDGTLYFVTEDGAEAIREDGFTLSDEDQSAHLLSFDDAKFYTIEQSFGGSARLALVYGVRDDEWYELRLSEQNEGEDLRKIEGTNDLTIVDGTHYDAFYDENGNEAGGHTWNTYYLHYDGRFTEYGGIEISMEQFLECEGAAEILERIEQGGGIVLNIIYHSNQIINVNYYYYDSDEGWSENHNMTLEFDGHGVTLIGEGDGIYQTAFLKDIAVYPDKFTAPTDIGEDADGVMTVSEPMEFTLDSGFNGEEARRLAIVFSYDSSGAVIEAYSPDDEQIVSHGSVDGRVLIQEGTGSRQLYLLDPEGRTAEPLLSDTVFGNSYEDFGGADDLNWCLEPALSPDGRFIAYASNKYALSDGEPFLRWGMWLYDLQSSTETRLTKDGREMVKEPVWRDDGTLEYIVVAPGGGEAAIAVGPDDPAFGGAQGSYQAISMSIFGAFLFKDENGWSMGGRVSELGLSFNLPSEWEYTGSTTASDMTGKVFELSLAFPADEYSPGVFRTFSEGTEYPQKFNVYEGESSDITINEETEHEWTNDEPYLFKFRQHVDGFYGGYDYCAYVVKNGDWCLYVVFTSTDVFDPSSTEGSRICADILRSIKINRREYVFTSWLPDEFENRDILENICNAAVWLSASRDYYRIVTEFVEDSSPDFAGIDPIAVITVKDEEALVRVRDALINLGYSQDNFDVRVDETVISSGDSSEDIQSFTAAEVEIIPSVPLYDYENAIENLGLEWTISGNFPGGESGVWQIVTLDGADYFYGQRDVSEEIQLYSFAVTGAEYSLENGLRVGMSVDEVIELYPEMKVMSVQEVSNNYGWNHSVFPHSRLGDDENYNYNGEHYYWADDYDGVMLANVKQDDGDTALYLALMVKGGKIAAMTFYNPTTGI